VGICGNMWEYVVVVFTGVGNALSHVC